MTREDVVTMFREKLQHCRRQKKYHGQFTSEDETRAVQAFRLVLENSNLSEHLVFEQLTGEKSS
jgi:hypothetical protein